MDLAEVSATAAKSEQAKEIAQSLKEIAPMDAPSVPMLATVPNCFQWGPVTDETRARGILEQVKVRSNEASLVKKPSALTDGWWVLFPKAHDMDTANSNRKMLLEKGVTDLWLFDKGPLQGAISLGLFKTRVRAEQAQKNLPIKASSPRSCPVKYQETPIGCEFLDWPNNGFGRTFEGNSATKCDRDVRIAHSL